MYRLHSTSTGKEDDILTVGLSLLLILRQFGSEILAGTKVFFFFFSLATTIFFCKCKI